MVFNLQSFVTFAIAPSWQLNKYTAGSWFNRVDVPWNRLDMRVQVVVPRGKRDADCNTGVPQQVFTPMCFLGDFQWRFGVWFLYIPLVVPHAAEASSAPRHHPLMAHSAFIQDKSFPDFTKRAADYSLGERTEHLKKLLKPELFDKAVKQLMLLEKFKDNPMALKRLVELNQKKRSNESANAPTSLAEQLSDVTRMSAEQASNATEGMKQPANANIQSMIGLALEPYTTLYGQTAWLGAAQGPAAPDTFSDSMYINIEWSIVEGFIFKPLLTRADRGDLKNTLSIMLSLSYYAFASPNNNLIAGRTKWETAYGGVKESAFKFGGAPPAVWRNSMDESIFCRFFWDGSIFCGVPFFRLKPPKVCFSKYCAMVP